MIKQENAAMNKNYLECKYNTLVGPNFERNKIKVLN